MEVSVTNSSPELQLHYVKKFAKDLVILFALHMAEKISSLLRQVLDHPSKVLYDPETDGFSERASAAQIQTFAGHHRP